MNINITDLPTKLYPDKHGHPVLYQMTRSAPVFSRKVGGFNTSVLPQVMNQVSGHVHSGQAKIHALKMYMWPTKTHHAVITELLGSCLKKKTSTSSARRLGSIKYIEQARYWPSSFPKAR